MRRCAASSVGESSRREAVIYQDASLPRSVLQFGQQHFGLGSQRAGAVHVARGQRGFGLLDELADMFRGLLLLVVQSPVDRLQAALGRGDGGFGLSGEGRRGRPTRAGRWRSPRGGAAACCVSVSVVGRRLLCFDRRLGRLLGQVRRCWRSAWWEWSLTGGGDCEGGIAFGVAQTGRKRERRGLWLSCAESSRRAATAAPTRRSWQVTSSR